MKRSKAQLNAISKSYRARERARLEARLEANDLAAIYRAQTVYKTERGFFNAFESKTPKFFKALNNAVKKNKALADRANAFLKGDEICF